MEELQYVVVKRNSSRYGFTYTAWGPFSHEKAMEFEKKKIEEYTRATQEKEGYLVPWKITEDVIRSQLNIAELIQVTE